MNQYKHYFSPCTNNQDKTAILLVNLGTPKSTSVHDVQGYLEEFLSDPRVVETPRLIWKIILYGFILRFRPSRTSKAYKKIWTSQGSPLLVYTKSLSNKLDKLVNENHQVFMAMTYGKPSIKHVLRDISKQGFDAIKVIPLYPQYSATTTAPVFDLVAKTLLTWRRIPKLTFETHYFAQESYIQAVAKTLKKYLKDNKPEQILFSFHGIPIKYITAGDPYKEQCEISAEKIAKTTNLKKGQWQLVFQSRLGKEPWLSPYADTTIKKMAKEGTKKIVVISPGFAVDCLETLEEMEMENKKLFLNNGGEQFDYIPCLNDSDEHTQMLKTIFNL